MKYWRLSFGISILGVLGVSCSSTNRYPDLTADPKVMVRQWVIPTKTEWFAGELGTEYSRPIFYENSLIVGSTSQGLMSTYPTLGQVRWVLPIENGVDSEIALDRDTLFFGGGDGYLYAVHAATGKIKWQYSVRNTVLSKPTISGGRLFVTTADDTVYAFDAGTGKWLWHYKRRSAQSTTIHGASQPIIDQDEVLVGLSDGYFVALGVPDGKLKWEKKLHEGRKFTDIDALPIQEEGVVYIPSYDGSLYALKRQGGETIWKFDAGSARAISLEKDRLYLSSSNGTVYAIQKNNAKELWKFELDLGVPTEISTTDHWVIFGSTQQYLYVLEKATGKAVYRYNTGYGSGFSSAPTLSADQKNLYVMSGGGNLMSFLIRNQKPQSSRGETDGYVFF